MASAGAAYTGAACIAVAAYRVAAELAAAAVVVGHPIAPPATKIHLQMSSQVRESHTADVKMHLITRHHTIVPSLLCTNLLLHILLLDVLLLMLHLLRVKLLHVLLMMRGRDGELVLHARHLW